GPGVYDVDQLAELAGRKLADRHNPIQVVGPRKVLLEVALHADVGPAEGIQPAAIDFSQRPRILVQQLRQLAKVPVLADREVSLARLQTYRPSGDGPKALEPKPQ